MNPPADTPFRLVFSRAVGDELRVLADQARARRVAARFAAALGVIQDRLRNSPLTWGDPFRVYPALGLTAYRRLHDELLVNYVVHEEQRIVWLDSIVPVFGHPLRPEMPGVSG